MLSLLDMTAVERSILILTGMSEYIKNNVYTLRSKKSLTQEEFAQKIGVSRQTVIAIEKGNYAPSVLLALNIARVFGVQVEDVFKIAYEK
jgi:putative transcriptional regulator